MNRAFGIRILAIIGLLAATVGAHGAAWAQTAGSSPTAGQALTWQSPNLRSPAVQAANENQLQIIGARSLPDNWAGSLRMVQAIEPSPPEPIGPGVAEGNPDVPQSAPPAGSPQGAYEKLDTGWKPIGAVSASIAPTAGELPANFAGPVFARAGEVVAPINESHNWPTFVYAWEASAVPHNPLYFEDVNLERYGYSHGILQPWISGGRFFLNVVFLPYHIVAEPPGRIEYPLGYYRPGDPAAPVRQIKPIKIPAAVAEAAFVIGMVIILP